MPYDKIVDSAKLDGAMTATADAIRGKTGKTADIPWNESTGFASEIASITTETAPNLQAKTATPSTSAQTIKPDSGYDGLSQVTVNAMPTATQATPSIAVTTGGLITASTTQTAGYVAAGTKSATKQLTTQAAKTITPSASNQTAAESGVYTTGAVTVKGDANLKAANIAKGISIFGITGTHVGGSNVKTGTFTAGTSFNNVPITITGLTFKPTRVICYLYWINSSYSGPNYIYYFDTQDSICVIGYSVDDEYDIEAAPGFSVTMNNDGFTINASTDDLEYALARGKKYKYIALG